VRQLTVLAPCRLSLQRRNWDSEKSEKTARLQRSKRKGRANNGQETKGEKAGDKFMVGTKICFEKTGRNMTEPVRLRSSSLPMHSWKRDNWSRTSRTEGHHENGGITKHRPSTLPSLCKQSLGTVYSDGGAGGVLTSLRRPRTPLNLQDWTGRKPPALTEPTRKRHSPLPR
jgi:hypothetical protein